jgi:Lhr-like helicase
MKRDEDLNEQLIVEWADAHFQQHGEWPHQKSGEIPGRQENWKSIDEALRRGFRDLPKGSSLAKVLENNGRKANRMNRQELSEKQIIKWARAHRKTHGALPTKRSGVIPDTDENWGAIDQALRVKSRGIKRRTSLSKLFAKHFKAVR